MDLYRRGRCRMPLASFAENDGTWCARKDSNPNLQPRSLMLHPVEPLARGAKRGTSHLPLLVSGFSSDLRPGGA
jgi:hypothetical protein